MTFAELVIVVAAGAGLYFVIAPVRRRLEARFHVFFRSLQKKPDRTVIDITDYADKKDKPKP